MRLKTVLQEDPRGKRLRLCQESAADFHSNADWKILAENRLGLDVRSKKYIYPQRYRIINC